MCDNNALPMLGGLAWCGNLYALEQGPPVKQYVTSLSRSGVEDQTRHVWAVDKESERLYLCGGSPAFSSSTFKGCVAADDPTVNICNRFDAMQKLQPVLVERNESLTARGIEKCATIHV